MMKTKTLNCRPFILTLLWCISGGITSTLAEDTPTDENQTPAQSTNTEKPNRIEPDKQTALLADLSKELTHSETEILSLKTADDSFDAYYHTSSNAQTHRGIIFMPDDFTHPNWPIIIEPLRTGLTEFGWNTLAIPLPAPITQATPVRTLPSLKAIKAKTPTEEPKETTTEPAETSPVTPPAQLTKKEKQSSDTYEQIIQRGITAVQALQQKGINQFVIAGIGTGATWATALAVNLQTQTDINLLIINAAQSQDISAPKLLTLIPELKLTTLDIYTSNPGSASRSNKEPSTLRLEKARRNNLNNYHQSRLPATSNTRQGEKWLIRYTRGLLETYIVKAEKDAIAIPSTPAPATNQPPGMPPAPPQKKQATPI